MAAGVPQPPPERRVETLIAEVLAKHREGAGGWCRCGDAPGYLMHSEHVAEFISAELGLTYFADLEEHWWSTRIYRNDDAEVSR